MIPKEVIERAIEGGWKKEIVAHYVDLAVDLSFDDYCITIGNPHTEDSITLSEESVALDPTFWQALGKVLEWEETTVAFVHSREDITTLGGHTWLIQAFRFYDLILTGGDTEAFWNELLK